MSTVSCKASVRRYFEEALDKKNLDVLDEIVARDCLIHRREAQEPIKGLPPWEGFSKCRASSARPSTT